MLNRRSFLKKSAMAGALAIGGGFPFESLAGKREQRLTILHTNDVHSRLEPFPMDGSKNQGLGGVASRAALISSIRKEAEHVLLLDAGDIFQGTPYFNLYKGEPEIKALTMMGYDAVTMGNHDFDAGVEGFARQLVHASFPVLTANYDFTGTALEGKTQPYQVFRKGDLKIGVFGLGIQLKGLVPEDAYGKTKYLEPIQVARTVTSRLKKKEGCDMVICLSHLGYDYPHVKVSDMILAKETEDIDLIIGGHTHTFLDEPTVLKNRKGADVVVNQVGWAGIMLGRMEFAFV
ncbi:MAG: twin-arginine translocation signal domain-containing protein [Sphingobacteriales bacterium]|nr:MAG: twin-arginine translocation signal domain-containing protein [Sphingobacteriales bacterium]